MATEKIEVVCDDNCGKCKIALWDEEFCYYICGLRRFIKTGDTATIEINQNKDLTRDWRIIPKLKTAEK